MYPFNWMYYAALKHMYRYTFQDNIKSASCLVCYITPLCDSHNSFLTGWVIWCSNVPQAELDPAMCCCLVCQSYLVCQADVFDERPVTVRLARGQLLPRGPALLQHPQLRALGFDEETDRACRGVSLTPQRLMTPKNLCPALIFGAFVCLRSSLPVGCSARLRVMIWRTRVETGVDVTTESSPSPLSVRVLSPELSSEFSRDSSNFCNHISYTQTWPHRDKGPTNVKGETIQRVADMLLIT